MEKGKHREALWSESVAVGSRDYVDQVGKALGGMARGRSIRNIAWSNLFNNSKDVPKTSLKLIS